jgi:16S rRNA processing protein RimM
MDLVAVARIRKPRGVRGEVWLDRFKESFPDLRAGESVWIEEKGGPRPLTVEGFFTYTKGAVLKLEGVDKPESAEALSGRQVLLPAEKVPAEGPDEFDTEEIVGYEVRDRARGVLGTIARVIPGPAYWIFHVSAPGVELEIPAVKGLGVRLDKGARRLEVELPEGYPGLPGEVSELETAERRALPARRATSSGGYSLSRKAAKARGGQDPLCERDSHAD